MFTNAGLKYVEKGYAPNRPVLIIPGLCSSAMCVEESTYPPWVGKRVWLDMTCIGFDKVWDTFPGINKSSKPKSKVGSSDSAPSLSAAAESLYGADIADAAARHDQLAKRRWVNHIMLNPQDGVSDPEGIRVRPVKGLDAVMYLDPGALTSSLSYVFGPLVEALQTIGYNDRTLKAAPYDWRLPPCFLEKRDGYFSSLKTTIEELYHNSGGKKVVVICHSLGNRAMHYFVRFMEKHYGRQWQSTYIEVWMAIGPLFLGAPKSIRAVVTGERMGLEAFLFEFEGVAMIRAISSSMWMWPFVTSDFEFDSFARLREENQSSKTKKSAVVYKNRTIKQIVTDGGVAHTWEKYERYYFDDDVFGSPEEMMKAPPIDKIFAIYGINLKTETAYFFKKNDSPNPVTSLCLDPDGKIPNYKCEGGIAFETKDTRQNCLKGKKRSGDGTVPYASLSFCKHWNGQNGCKVKIAEIEGAEHRAILRNKTFTQLIIETACQLPPPTDLPNTFSDCTWDAMLEVRGRDEPCVIQALTKEIVIQQKSGKKTKQRFAYTQVADLLVDETGDSLTIEFEKAAQPFIFKAADATAIVDELASRCRFITLMETSNEEQRDEYGRTELHLAVIEGDLARASEILRLSSRKHILINAIDNTGSTPLHYAASRGNLDLVALLLEVSAVDVNLPAQKGNAPIHDLVRLKYDSSPAQRGAQEKWRVLMERMVALGLNVNVVALGQRGESPLHQAVKVCNLPAIEWLISHKANVNLTNSALETPLHYAVRIGQEDIILALLRAGSDVLLCAKDKQAPLDLAQNSRNPNLFRMLSEYKSQSVALSAGSKATGVPGSSRTVGFGSETALHTAVNSNNLNAVFQLLLEGANVNALDRGGRTPFHCAATAGFTDVLIVLLQRSCAVNSLTNDGDHVLHLLLANLPPAAETEQQKYLDALGALRKKLVNVAVQNALGNTPLHTAAIQGNELGVKWLLKEAPDAKALCDVPNLKGETALHFAVAAKRFTIVRSLLNHGASPTIVASPASTLAPGQSPLDYANQHCPDMVGLLGSSTTRARASSKAPLIEASPQVDDQEDDEEDVVEFYAANAKSHRKSFYLSSNTTSGRKFSSIYMQQVDNATRKSKMNLAAVGPIRGRGGARGAGGRSRVAPVTQQAASADFDSDYELAAPPTSTSTSSGVPISTAGRRSGHVRPAPTLVRTMTPTQLQSQNAPQSPPSSQRVPTGAGSSGDEDYYQQQQEQQSAEYGSSGSSSQHTDGSTAILPARAFRERVSLRYRGSPMGPGGAVVIPAPTMQSTSAPAVVHSSPQRTRGTSDGSDGQVAPLGNGSGMTRGGGGRGAPRGRGRPKYASERSPAPAAGESPPQQPLSASDEGPSGSGRGRPASVRMPRGRGGARAPSERPPSAVERPASERPASERAASPATPARASVEVRPFNAPAGTVPRPAPPGSSRPRGSR